MSNHEDIPPDVLALWQALFDPRPMRRGSIAERYVKCSKKGCPCNEQAELRHGPYYSLTRIEGGKTRSRYLSAQQSALAQQQIDAGQAFRRRVEDYWEACEQWADAQLSELGEGGTEETKKGASEKRSRRRSSPR